MLFLRNVKMLGVIVIKSPDVEEITTMMFLLVGGSGRNHEAVQKNIISYWNVALDSARNCLLMLSCPWESYKTFVVVTCLQSPWCSTFIKVTRRIKALCFLKQGLWYEIQLLHFLQNNELTETLTSVHLNMVITLFTALFCSLKS